MISLMCLVPQPLFLQVVPKDYFKKEEKKSEELLITYFTYVVDKSITAQFCNCLVLYRCILQKYYKQNVYYWRNLENLIQFLRENCLLLYIFSLSLRPFFIFEIRAIPTFSQKTQSLYRFHQRYIYQQALNTACVR